MRARSRILTTLAAVLMMISPTLVGSVASPASAATGCSVVMSRTYTDSHSGLYHFYKYQCSGQQAYGKLTGAPGPVCIQIQLGSDTVGGTCYHIPTGYTPPKTSTTTNVVSAGDLVDIVNICIKSYYGFLIGCYHQ